MTKANMIQGEFYTEFNPEDGEWIVAHTERDVIYASVISEEVAIRKAKEFNRKDADKYLIELANEIGFKLAGLEGLIKFDDGPKAWQILRELQTTMHMVLPGISSAYAKGMDTDEAKRYFGVYSFYNPSR